jgi:tetratricopeptide (TPR) repeat protein
VQGSGEPPALFVNVPPLPAHELMGRDELLADLVKRLLSGQSPALSTAGMPGVGKTALAVALAYHPDVQSHFQDGILWAGLGTQPDVPGIQASWADALGLDISSIADPQRRTEVIGNAIGRRRMLVVLDDTWALEPAQLLRPGGHVTCLLTTRDEEIARAFAPTQSIHVPVLEEDPSLKLLRRLALEACEVDPQAASNLAKTTGGLPLTLEVLGGYLAQPVHSQFPELSKQAFAELADPRRRLALAQERLGGRRGQKQTLEAVIALSIEQLEQARPEAMAAFYALGAFAPKPARFDRPAAESVTGTDAAVLALLVARNLLEVDADGRLALHQVLADFAVLRTPDEARVRHREHYLAVADAPPQDWPRIETVYPQIQQAWNRQMRLGAGSGELIRFVNILSTYQRNRGLWQDRRDWLMACLQIVQGREEKGETSRLLNNLGLVYSALGDKRKALAFYERALQLQRQVGDRGGEATTLNNLGGVYDALGDKRKALAFYEQALPIYRQAGDRSGEAIALNNLGMVYNALGDQRKALDFFEQALDLTRQVGTRGGEAITLNNLGMVYSALGDQRKALDFFELALPLQRQVGARGGEADTLNNLGGVYNALGDQRKALDFFELALPLRRQVGDRGGEADTLNNLGGVYAALGDQRRALDFFEQALELTRLVGDRWGEVTTRWNVGDLFLKTGEWDRAEKELRETVELAEKVEHPRLSSIREWLARAQRR